MAKPVCAVVGIGPGNGAAIARRFAAEGYAVALLSRSEGLSGELAATLADARAFACDAADAASVEAAFSRLSAEMGEVDTLVYNAGSGVWGGVDDITPADFEICWRVNTLGTLLTARQVIPGMRRRGGGNIVVVGATASRRGTARTVAFAPAKAGQRVLAEALARQLWPTGIHVSVIIVDGIVDLPRTRARMPDKPDSFFVKPDDVAETAYRLATQPRSAWSFEVEARPFGEMW